MADVVMVKLCDKVLEVRVSDSVMTVVLAFKDGVLRPICGYATQSCRIFFYERFL